MTKSIMATLTLTLILMVTSFMTVANPYYQQPRPQFNVTDVSAAMERGRQAARQQQWHNQQMQMQQAQQQHNQEMLRLQRQQAYQQQIDSRAQALHNMNIQQQQNQLFKKQPQQLWK